MFPCASRPPSLEHQPPPCCAQDSRAGPGGTCPALGAVPAALQPSHCRHACHTPCAALADPDLTTLALGTDLTTLGLNLNSPEALWKTFASPWADGPGKAEPDFKVRRGREAALDSL